MADLRISPGRFCLAVASVAVLIGAGTAYTLSKGHDAGLPETLGAYMVPVGACLTALVACCALLLISAPIWWALCRFGLRGWASSLLAGAALVMALCSLPVLAGAHPIQSSVPLWLLVLAQAPFGLAYGWIIWRISFMPPKKPGVADAVGLPPQPASTDAERD